MTCIYSKRIYVETFGQIVMWSGAYNDQIWLLRAWASDFENVLIDFNFTYYIICILVNLECEFGQIKTRDNFFGLHVVYNVWKGMANISCEFGQLITRYDFVGAGWVILNNIQTDSNVT